MSRYMQLEEEKDLSSAEFIVLLVFTLFWIQSTSNAKFTLVLFLYQMICSGKCVLPHWSREFWITLERKGKGEVQELGIWVEQRGKAHTSMQKVMQEWHKHSWHLQQENWESGLTREAKSIHPCKRWCRNGTSTLCTCGISVKVLKIALQMPSSVYFFAHCASLVVYQNVLMITDT